MTVVGVSTPPPLRTMWGSELQHCDNIYIVRQNYCRRCCRGRVRSRMEGGVKFDLVIV